MKSHRYPTATSILSHLHLLSHITPKLSHIIIYILPVTHYLYCPTPLPCATYISALSHTTCILSHTTPTLSHLICPVPPHPIYATLLRPVLWTFNSIQRLYLLCFCKRPAMLCWQRRKQPAGRKKLPMTAGSASAVCSFPSLFTQTVFVRGVFYRCCVCFVI